MLENHDYSILAELVYIGRWVVNGNKAPNKRSATIENVFLDICKDYEKTIKEKYPNSINSDIISVLHEQTKIYIDDFINSEFYIELAYRLVEYQFPDKPCNDNEYQFKKRRQMEVYLDEFNNNGLKNVSISFLLGGNNDGKKN